MSQEMKHVTKKAAIAKDLHKKVPAKLKTRRCPSRPPRDAYVRLGRVIGFAELALLIEGPAGEPGPEATEYEIRALQTILTESIEQDGNAAGDATAEQLVEFGVLLSHLDLFSGLDDFDENLNLGSILSMSQAEADRVLARLRAAVGVKSAGLSGWLRSIVGNSSPE